MQQPESQVFQPRHNIEVDATGIMTDIPSLVDAVNNALRENGVSKADMDEFNSLLEGGYDHILRVVLSWVRLIVAA
jgi:uncharacterized protein YqgV (UPF0045/DUF77 family)